MEPSLAQPSGFRLLLSAIALGHLASVTAKLVLPVVAATETGSPLVVAIVGFAFSLPWLVLGLPVGVLIDQLDRRRLLIAVTGLRATALSALLIMTLTGDISGALLAAVALTLGCGEVFVEPSATVLTPQLVPPGMLARANARLLAAETAIELAGPPLAGALLGLSLVLASGVGTLAFIASASTLLAVSGTFRPAPATERRSVSSTIMGGLRFVWGDVTLRTISLMAGVINACWGAWATGFVLYAVSPDGLDLTPFAYGAVMAADGAGGLLGALIAGSFAGWFGRRWMIGINIACNGLLFLATPIASTAWMVGLAIGLGGIGGPLWGVAARTLQQELVPDEMRGRVSTAYRTIGLGAATAGPLIAGLVIEQWGSTVLFTGVGIVTLAMYIPFARVVTEGRMRSGAGPVHAADS